MDNKDVQQIREEFAKVIEDNINPQFDDVRNQFGDVRNQFGDVRNRLDRIETDMVTKSYLDDKLADLEGNLISKLRKEDEKVNRLIEVLKNKSVLSDQDTDQFKEFQIFPKFLK